MKNEVVWMYKPREKLDSKMIVMLLGLSCGGIGGVSSEVHGTRQRRWREAEA